MTGEINLQGNITKIGGLESKILGSIRAGVNKVLYPIENVEEFDEFVSKYKDSIDLSKYTFQSINTIHDVVKIAILK